MKILKFFFLIYVVLIILSCDKKDEDLYPPYPDNTNKNDNDLISDDDIIKKGDIGDPCKTKLDCKTGLVCIDKKCAEEIFDEDIDTVIPDEVIDEVTDIDLIEPDTEEPDDVVPDPDVPDVDNHIPFGCGNGKTEYGEECDNGDFNSDFPGVAGVTCRKDCTYAKCGDKVADQYEMCDDGNNLSGDYCGADCKSITGRCGDGTVQTNELCDKSPSGNGIGSYCNADCTAISGSCGDGVVQDNEICDKADFDDGTGPFYCAADCKKIIGSCGDGTPQPNETCDDGGNNGKYGYCNSTCSGQGSYCGDGVKDWQGDEVCDDGNNEDNDYCSPDCMIFYGFCGDGAVQGNEACDNASFGDGTGLYCSSDCKIVLGECGDETVQDHEQCDFGTKNGILFCEYGEEPPCNSCNTVCNFVSGTPTFCGDGKVDTQNSEVCDKADSSVGEGKGIGAYCSFDCKEITGFCGDGVKQEHEACDNATINQGIGPEYCSEDCTAVIGFCGDGTPQANEMCDNGDGNTEYCAYSQTSCFVCSKSCQTIEGITSFCGNSKADPDNGELCDNGLNNGKYKINAPGYCNTDCKGLGAGGFCGDGNTQLAENEECDNGPANGAQFCEYGLTSCDLCNTSCETTVGIATFCGDEEINGAESCDDGLLNGTYGKCNAGCTGIGRRCGDSVDDPEEGCDDGDNNGKYGFCSFDCSGPGKRCGDGVKQPEEVCDDGEDDNGEYQLGFPGSCNADCQGIGNGGYCGNSSPELPFEECDHGGVIKFDCEYGEESCKVCDVTCMEQDGVTSFCGDNHIDSGNGEVCDDGDLNGTYGKCKSDCLGPFAKCGDKNIDSGFGEVCDDGGDNGEYGFCKINCSGDGPFCGDNEPNGPESCDDGLINNGKYGFCKADCTGPGEKCGDSVIQSLEGEVCDDGGNNGHYGFCKADCKGDGPFCGDGETTDGENCDSGADNGKYGFCKTDCSGINNTCGDGNLNPENDEVCDSGVHNGEYGYCKIDCSGIGEHCGDDIKQDNETCDDGEDNGSYDFCNIACTGPGEHCGDGIQNGDEYCDSGSNNGKYEFCNADCTGLSPYCGDREIQISDGETCDDGILNGTQGKCNSTCTGPHIWCGDGTKNGLEECDDGGLNGTYGKCKSDCSGLGIRCGDTLIQPVNGETCDDGSNNGKPGYCNSTCKGMTEYCGDQITQTNEVCDDGVNNGKYNHLGTSYCSSDCLSYGDGGFCGDDAVQEDYEGCDDGINNGDPGFCNADCTANFICGDEVVDEGEFCDTNPVQCSDFAQFSSGTVACPDDCSVPDFSSCVEAPVYSSPFFSSSQTLCYNNTTSVPCPAEGNAFYGQDPQFSYESHDFTVSTDTISESVSGLVWQKATPSTYSGCTAGDPAGTECTIGEALNYCENFELNGFGDWRVPSTYELSNIMNLAKSDPLVFADFTSTQSDTYWSIGNLYHLVSMLNGTTVRGNKTDTGFVKCVRGNGQFIDREIFQSGDLLVDFLDITSSKVVFWQYDSSEIEMSWEDALLYCSTASEGGVDNFRLPTVVELQSLVFESLYTIPTLVGSGNFWTSTTAHTTPAMAYSVDFATGNVNINTKTGTNFVICVK